LRQFDGQRIQRLRVKHIRAGAGCGSAAKYVLASWIANPPAINSQQMKMNANGASARPNAILNICVPSHSWTGVEVAIRNL
jgi:hypothetical protein